MARKGENIYHRKDNRWEGRYIIGRKMNGKPKFKSVYARTYSEVKKKLVILKSEFMKFEENSPVLVYGNGSLSDWMDYWLDIVVGPYIKESTYQLYRRNLEKHLRPCLGNLPLKHISNKDIQKMVNSLWEKLAPSTLHGVCRLLTSILSGAVKERLLIRSPYEEIRLPKFRQKQPRVLSEAEQNRLEHLVMETGNLKYLICLYTGLRVGELCALRFEDINFEDNTLSVCRSVKRVMTTPLGGIAVKSATKLVVGDPKTESSVREIPLPFFLTKMLLDQRQEAGASKENYIFQNSKGYAADPRTVQKQFERLTEKAGICGAHMHTLRHTFAMRCLERGMGYKALSEILGHSSSNITIKCYDNCTKESKQKLMHSVSLMADPINKPSKLVMAVS